MNTMKRHWLFDLVSRNTFHCNLVDNGLNQYGTVTSGGITDSYTYNRWGALTDTRPFSYGYYDNLLCSLYTNRTLGQSRVCSYDYDALKRLRFKDASPRNAPRRYHSFTYSGWSLLCETLTTDRRGAESEDVFSTQRSQRTQRTRSVKNIFAFFAPFAFFALKTAPHLFIMGV